MKLAELQKKIADVLGVSGSQKELSFEIFLNKISEILLEGITLKVPRIGFFQLKNEPAKNGIRPLIFSPFSEDFSRDMRQLYLTIDVAPKRRNTPEFDSNIFSIGVGKPLLPLSIDELPDTETSYAMLRKSIEERVKEILTESDQIPNFNIWDDYYKSPNEFEGESGDEAKSQLSELTSDLHFMEGIIPDKIPENILENYDLPLMDTDQPESPENYDQYTDEIEINEETEEIDNSLSVKEDGIDNENVKEIPIVENELNNAVEIPSEEEDYSALENFKYNETSNQLITISELLDDTTPSTNMTKLSDGREEDAGEIIIPEKEVLDRILADEKIEEELDQIKIFTDELPGQKKSLFEELHELDKVELSAEEIEEDTFDESQYENEEEKIEWNNFAYSTVG